MLKRVEFVWNRVGFPAWTAPIALLLAVVASYGLRLASLGFYWDDWPYLWFYHVFGPNGMYNSLGADRPLLGVLYEVTFGLLGDFKAIGDGVIELRIDFGEERTPRLGRLVSAAHTAIDLR